MFAKLKLKASENYEIRLDNMKRCPQCRIEYFDDMLEFCLEDGARLVVATISSADEFLTIDKTEKKNFITNADTVRLSGSENAKPVAFSGNAPSSIPKTVEQVNSVKTGNIA